MAKSTFLFYPDRNQTAVIDSDSDYVDIFPGRIKHRPKRAVPAMTMHILELWDAETVEYA